MLTCLYDDKNGFQLLLNPTKNASSDLAQVDPTYQADLIFIKSMLSTNPSNRPTLEEVRDHIHGMSATPYINGRLKLSDLSLSYSSSTGPRHNSTTINQIGALSGYFNRLSVYSTFSSSRSLRYGISSEIHDQKQSYLCWSFAITSLLSFIIADFIDNLPTFQSQVYYEGSID